MNARFKTDSGTRQGDSGLCMITSSITAETNTGGQFYFASKEADLLTTLSGTASDFAPFLDLTPSQDLIVRVAGITSSFRKL